MPSRTIPFLSYTAAALIAVYLVLVVVTVTLAAVQTNLAVEVNEAEQDIVRLESRYYAMVAEIDRVDPGSRGLMKPEGTTYAVSAAAPTVTLR